MISRYELEQGTLLPPGFFFTASISLLQVGVPNFSTWKMGRGGGGVGGGGGGAEWRELRCINNPLNFRQHPSAHKAATGTNVKRAAAGSCSFPTVLKCSRELHQKGSRKRRPKTKLFIRLSYGPKCYVNRP